jgi:hypothetical protein
MTGRVLAAMTMLSLAACGPIHTTVRPTVNHLAGVQRVAVVVVEDGAFTVVKERAKATATGAVLFGLVGAAVASAANHSMDREETDKIRPGLAGFSPAPPLRDAFMGALKSDGRIQVEMVESERALQGKDHDVIIQLTIKEWGVRLPSRAISDHLAAFAEIQARMTRARSQETLWDEHEVSLGNGRHDLAAYRHDAALLRSELTDMLQSAGYRLANLLIYPREKPQ